MKFFRKKRNREAGKQRGKTRSVVFVEQSQKTLGNGKTFRRKTVLFNIFKRIKLPTVLKKAISKLILLAVAVLIAYILVSLTSFSTGLTSPLPNGFMHSQLNEVDKKIADELKNEGIEVKKIDSSISSEYHVFLKDNGEVIFSAEKDLAEQIDSLQFILNRLTMEGRSTFVKLDLRFEKPVIVIR